jgi:hypothetical protein
MAELAPEENEVLERAWSHLGQHRPLPGGVEQVEEMLREQRKKAVHMP